MPATPVATSPPPSPHDLVLFVSLNPEKLGPVTRLSLRPGPRQLIGAERGENRQITYYTDAVVGLTRAEVEAFGKEYERTIGDGHLLRRERKDWEAYTAAQKTRAREEQAKIEAATKAAEAAAKAADNGTARPSGGDVS